MKKKEWKTMKAYGWHFSCLERDDYRCVMCGSEENILVHHIDGSRKFGFKNMNNHLSNLQTLCSFCHAIAHGSVTKNTHEIMELVESGLSYGDVGKKFGITRQRVEQIFKKNGGITNCPSTIPFVPPKKKSKPDYSIIPN